MSIVSILAKIWGTVLNFLFVTNQPLVALVPATPASSARNAKLQANLDATFRTASAQIREGDLKLQSQYRARGKEMLRRAGRAKSRETESRLRNHGITLLRVARGSYF